jgi:hypothetical protein
MKRGHATYRSPPGVALATEQRMPARHKLQLGMPFCAPNAIGLWRRHFEPRIGPELSQPLWRHRIGY